MAKINIIPKPNSIRQGSGKLYIKSKAPEDIIKSCGIDSSVTDEEGYRIHIDSDGVKVAAGGRRGLFYAKQTLRQLLASSGDNLDFLTIEDSPAYRHRAFMIDCARHFFSIDDIKKMIDAASLFKFNIFHWHLTDDQGWRIQIDKYPKLTEIGSVRKNSKFGKLQDPEPYGGFYTKDEMREIVAYCAERFIDVIPEFDIPGHASAAIASYPELSCSGKQIDLKNRAGIFNDILCAGNDKTFDFVFGVLDEITEISV